jgi:hypothetical protein
MGIPESHGCLRAAIIQPSGRNLEGEVTPGTCVSGVSLRIFGSTKSSKRLRHPSGSDLNQLPHCYIRPPAKLAVKPTNWWLRPNLNGAPGRIIRAARSPLRGRPLGVQRRCGAVFAAAPRILRFAPDRRRLSGDVQPGAAPGCRTGLVCLSAVRTAHFRPGGSGCRKYFLS